MRKILINILAVTLLFTTMIWAQNNDKASAAVHVINSGDAALWNSYQKTLQGVRVIVIRDSSAAIDTPNVKVSGITLNADSLVITSSPHFLTANNISRSSADTIVFGFNSQNIRVYNDASGTDTLFISNLPSFPSTSTAQVYTDKSTWSTNGDPPLNINTKWSVLYIKFGTSATSGKPYRVIVY